MSIYTSMDPYLLIFGEAFHYLQKIRTMNNDRLPGPSVGVVIVELVVY